MALNEYSVTSETTLVRENVLLESPDICFLIPCSVGHFNRSLKTLDIKVIDEHTTCDTLVSETPNNLLQMLDERVLFEEVLIKTYGTLLTSTFDLVFWLFMLHNSCWLYYYSILTSV